MEKIHRDAADTELASKADNSYCCSFILNSCGIDKLSAFSAAKVFTEALNLLILKSKIVKVRALQKVSPNNKELKN